MNLKKLSEILLWGSLWGLTEATVGYLLHLLPVNIGWLLWYPIAFAFLNKVYCKTNEKWTILAAAAMAGGAKLLDLLLPVRIDRVINPALSILFEGLAVYLAYMLMEKRAAKRYAVVLLTLASNTFWRTFYLTYLLVTPQWMQEISPLSGNRELFIFMIVQNAVTSVLIALYLLIVRSRVWFTIKGKFQPARYQSKAKGCPYIRIAFIGALTVLNLIIRFV